VNAAQRGAFAKGVAPQDCALIVRVQSPEVTGLLAGQKDALALAGAGDDDAGAEVVVLLDTLFRGEGAVGPVTAWAAAGQVPDVAGQALEGPFQLAGRHSQSQDGVAGPVRGRRGILAGGGEDQAALDIDRRRRPDR